MRAADAMSQKVVAISPDAPLAQAVRLMVEGRISGLPVIDTDGRAVGILTQGDLLRRVETGTEGNPPRWLERLFMTAGRLAAEYVHTHGRRVAELMTRDVVSVDENTPVSDVVSLMQGRRIKRLPVTRGDRVVGIISRADIVRKLGEALGAPAVTADDASIRQSVLAQIARQPWAHTRQLTVSVENGCVMLDGAVFDMRQRDGLRVMAENTPGVKEVVNRLVCVEPYSGHLIYEPDENGPAESDARKPR